MKFIVATPSYHNLADLRRCIGSVRAQARFGEAEKLKTHESGSGHISEISVQHIVQDGGSENWSSFAQGFGGSALRSEAVANNTPQLPTSSYQLLLHSEADAGMYDAINKAWDQGEGEVYSWLNCDEQYLPGTLKKVAAYFDNHPDVDAVFGNAIIVDGEGQPLAVRREIPLRKMYVANGFLYALSCTTFFRSRLRERGLLRLDDQYRFSADAELVLRLLEAGVSFGHLDDTLALFEVGGQNLSFRPEMIGEGNRIKQRYGRFRHPWLRKLVLTGRYGERFLAGCYRKANLIYEYCLNERGETKTIEVSGVGTRFNYEWYREKS